VALASLCPSFRRDLVGLGLGCLFARRLWKWKASSKVRRLEQRAGLGVLDAVAARSMVRCHIVLKPSSV
jgi:hypothetical protein